MKPFSLTSIGRHSMEKKLTFSKQWWLHSNHEQTHTETMYTTINFACVKWTDASGFSTKLAICSRSIIKQTHHKRTHVRWVIDFVMFKTLVDQNVWSLSFMLAYPYIWDRWNYIITLTLVFFIKIISKHVDLSVFCFRFINLSIIIDYLIARLPWHSIYSYIHPVVGKFM